MQHVKHRNRTKILAWIDFGMGIFCCVFAIISVIILYLISISYFAGESLFEKFFNAIDNQNLTAHLNSTGTLTRDGLFGYLYLSYAFDCVFCLVQIVAAIFLIKSTSPTRAMKSALRMTYVWFAVDILIIVIYFLWRIVDGYWFMLATGFLIRVLLLIFVWTYISALREASRLSDSAVIQPRQIKTFS